MKKKEQTKNYRDICRKNLLKYTRMAFQMIPTISEPYILDIGCGTGVVTLELAKLSNGRLIGVDINQKDLDIFMHNIFIEGLTDRVFAKNLSLFDMDFKESSFDIIWSEGAISAIGFERGLVEFGRFLKAGGYLVIHDSMEDKDEKLQCIKGKGYRLLGHFILSQEVWYREYYIPLRAQYQKIKLFDRSEKKDVQELEEMKKEIDAFENYSSLQQSEFFVMQKPVL